jgi:hypothetical protein
MKDNVLNTILIVAAFSAIVLIALGEEPGQSALVTAASQVTRMVAATVTPTPAGHRSADVLVVASTGQ